MTRAAVVGDLRGRHAERAVKGNRTEVGGDGDRLEGARAHGNGRSSESCRRARPRCPEGKRRQLADRALRLPWPILVCRLAGDGLRASQRVVRWRTVVGRPDAAVGEEADAPPTDPPAPVGPAPALPVAGGRPLVRSGEDSPERLDPEPPPPPGAGSIAMVRCVLPR